MQTTLPTPKSMLRHLWLPLAAGMLLRVLWALQIEVMPVSDSAMYWHLAKSIAVDGQFAFPDGSLTAYWPVGAPAVYAAGIKLLGTGLWTAVVINLLAACLTLWLVFQLTHKVTGSLAAATAATWVTALWPAQIQYTTVIATEMLFNLNVLTTLWCWFRALDAERLKARILWAMGAGCALAVAAFIRPTASPLLLLLPVVALLLRQPWQQLVPAAAVAAMSFFLLMNPWAERNKALFGERVAVSTNFGPNLWMGSGEGTNGGYRPLMALKFDNEIEQEKHYRKLAIDHITANPGVYLREIFTRAKLTYDRETIGLHWNLPTLQKLLPGSVITAMKVVSSGYWYLVLAVGTVGLWQALRHIQGKHRIAAFCLTGLMFAVVPVLTVGQDRYHFALMPFLALGVGYAVRALFTPSGQASAAQIAT